MQSWESVYRVLGEFQAEPEPHLADSIKMLKEQGVKRVLDFGCGTGRHSILLAKSGFEVVATDISPTALGILSSKIGREKIGNITLARNGHDSIPFPDESFDAIVCLSVLHHNNIDNIAKIAGEFYRLAKPNGVLLLTELSSEDMLFGKGTKLAENTFMNIPEWPDGGITHHFFTEGELRGLFGGWHIKELTRMAIRSEGFGRDVKRWKLVAVKP